MTHVITQGCCNDSSCVDVCPADCIHPGPGHDAFVSTEMLYIDPAGCIDCGACIDVCPVGAIVPDHALTPDNEVYREINASYFAAPPQAEPAAATRAAPPAPRGAGVGVGGTLRVAIVGSGPSACYAAEELLATPGLRVEVSMFERLPMPWGLVRYGVAPDHQGTKAVTQLFQRTARRPGFSFFLDCEIGEHLTLHELLAHHHAVIVAVGAPADRRLGIPGEDLPGSHAAREFVGWYNGHPDHARRAFDLSGERAVVVGNGNVALDVARVLLMTPDELVRTDVPPYAVEALSASTIREVVVLGRRGPAEAAYTAPELHALTRLPGLDVVVRHGDTRTADGGSWKARLASELARRPSTAATRRIVLQFRGSPAAVLGKHRVEGLRVVHNEMTTGPNGRPVPVATDRVQLIGCGLVLRSVGYRGRPVPGLPFDAVRGVIPNDDGRVVDPSSGAPLAGFYATGWIKRGPSGVIGTNRLCARQTVEHLVADFRSGRLAEQVRGAAELRDLVTRRRPEWIDLAGWSAIDHQEQLTGRANGRPRIKLTDRNSALQVASLRPARPV